MEFERPCHRAVSFPQTQSGITVCVCQSGSAGEQQLQTCVINSILSKVTLGRVQGQHTESLRNDDVLVYVMHIITAPRCNINV